MNYTNILEKASPPEKNKHVLNEQGLPFTRNTNNSQLHKSVLSLLLALVRRLLPACSWHWYVDCCQPALGTGTSTVYTELVHLPIRAWKHTCSWHWYVDCCAELVHLPIRAWRHTCSWHWYVDCCTELVHLPIRAWRHTCSISFSTIYRVRGSVMWRNFCSICFPKTSISSSG